jgi:BlaI family penicillinase repressor
MTRAFIPDDVRCFSVAVKTFADKCRTLLLPTATFVGNNKVMSKKSLPSLSAAEQAIMDLIWQRQPIGLNDLLELVNAERDESVSRATLQTQLTRLEAKGWLKRDDSARAHLYAATVGETSGRKSVLTELKERLFGGSSMALVRCLVESGEISEAELAELKALVKQKGGES